MQNQTSSPSAVDKAALDQAFDALKTFDWGGEPKDLVPILDALPATRGDAAARRDLETRLSALLASGLSRAAKDFVCRALTVIGTAASVPALASLLADAELAHMARYALERIPEPEAAAALRGALPKLSDKQKIGAIGSLGVRRDEASVPVLGGLIGGSDPTVAAAAANALGDIGTPAAAKALCAGIGSAPAPARPAVADAVLAAAERLSAAGNQRAAADIYQSLLAGNPAKHVRLAAMRGTLRIAGNKQ